MAMGLLVSLSLGCTLTGRDPEYNKTEDTDFDAWVDRELTPYLVDQLSLQPRFRQEPILLIAMRDADVRSDIDGLTRNLRAHLMDKLLLAAGTDLVWQPSETPYEHHRQPDRLRCKTANPVRYFIGIDINATSLGHAHVRVRALDIGAGAWVTGFGQSWEGRLTPKQQRALNNRQIDEYLRGLRVLPFLDTETDLLASYLAQNIGCLLRGQVAPDDRIIVDPASTEQPILQNVLKLVAHNIAQQRVAVSDDETQEGSLTLGGSLNQINGSLHQLWIQVHAKSAEVNTIRVDTDAYMTIGQSSDVPAENTALRSKLRPGNTENHTTDVLSELRLLSGRTTRDCLFTTYQELYPDNAVPAEKCFEIEFDLSQSSYVMVLLHRLNGMLVSLPPEGCLSATDSWQRLEPRRNRSISGLRSDNRTTGIESVYVIAVVDARIAHNILNHMSHLPDGCMSSGYTTADTEYNLSWLATLDHIVGHNESSVDWQSVTIRQVAN